MGHALPSLPSGIRTLTQEEGDRLNRIRGDGRPVTPENCLTCGGKKRFLWWNPGRTEVVEWDCSCIDQWLLHRYLSNAGVPLVYQRIGWADVAHSSDSTEIVRWWIDHAADVLDRGLGLMLSGSPGTGKTMLAALALKAVLGAGYDGFMSTYSGLIDLLMNSWHDPADRDWWMRRVRNASFLVIDDLGRERKGQRTVGADEADRTGATRGQRVNYSLPMAESTLEEVIRHRVGSSRPTIITTNLTAEQVKAGYGSNSMSLLSESTVVCELVAPDFRPEAQSNLVTEIQRGLHRPVVLG